VAGTRLANLISGALIVAAGVWIWLTTRGFPELRDGHPGPALFPGVIAVALVACGGALLFDGVRRPGRLRAELGSARPAWDGVSRVVAAILLGLLYPLLQGLVGFIPTAAALILGVALMLRAKPLPATLVAAGGAAAIYLAFTRLLGVPL
jgi:putative tricarboxylic transport membrane protein